MIRSVLGSLDADHDLITDLYNICCSTLYSVFHDPARLEFGPADLLFCEIQRSAQDFFDSLSPIRQLMGLVLLFLPIRLHLSKPISAGNA